jgi:heat-inducible transcriptional repressor
MMLDERKIKILAAVVHDYIATAEPIGSRTIARKYRIGISPATIRNEMADLEEQGYLHQPHTSAGRVPSHKGYRYYVDFLMPIKKLSAAEQALIRSIFNRRVNELEELVKEAARVISNLTSYTTLTLGPQLKSSHLKYIQVNRIDETRGLLLMVTNYGTVSHNIIDMPPSGLDPRFQKRLNPSRQQ